MVEKRDLIALRNELTNDIENGMDTVYNWETLSNLAGTGSYRLSGYRGKPAAAKALAARHALRGASRSEIRA
eukprot:1373407-Amorphochlora_amoeboformis.AAC.2